MIGGGEAAGKKPKTRTEPSGCDVSSNSASLMNYNIFYIIGVIVVIVVVLKLLGLF